MSGKTGGGGRQKDLLGNASNLLGQATLIVRYSVKWADTHRAEVHLMSISVYPPSRSRNGQFLVVGKGWQEGVRLVAFHRNTDLVSALAGFFTKWWTGKLEWKQDKYSPEG